MPKLARSMLFVALGCAVLGVDRASFAQRKRGGPSLPQPSLQSVWPPGVSTGGVVDLTIRGSDLEGINSLWFDHPGLRALPLKGLTFRVVCASGTPVGYHDVRIVNAYGISNPRTFVVSDRVESYEVEPNNSLDKASPAVVNSVINGEIAATDVDCFWFEGKKGQRLIFDLEAERVDSRLDATLRLFDPTGREIASDRDSHGADPFLDVTVPVDGRYRVMVHDVTYQGSADHVYRLTITDGPYLDAVIPAVAHAGETGVFRLIGRNLGGEPAPDLTADGRTLEQKTITLTPPGSEDLDPDHPSRGQIPSPRAPGRGFEYFLTSPSGSSNALFIGLSNDPIIVEKEPNDDAKHAQTVSVPCDISASFGSPGDLDLYRFRARKGQVFWIEATSERLGTPADPVFLIQKVNEKEEIQELGTGDDTENKGDPVRFHTGSVDAELRWLAPEDGLYQVAVNDLYSSQRGDVRLGYRLNIRPERPGFRLFLLPDSLNQPDALTVPAGGRALAYVQAVREDGFNGPIQVEATVLPAGIHCRTVVIPSGQSAVPIVFEAEEGERRPQGSVRLVGRGRFVDRKDVLTYVSGATPLGPDVTETAFSGAIIWPPGTAQGPAPQLAPARLTRKFMLKVVDPDPLTLSAQPGSRIVAQGGRLKLGLTVVRRDGFTEVVNVTQVNPLPGQENPGPTVAIPKTESKGTYELSLPKNLATGVYTVALQGGGPFPFHKDPKEKNRPNVNIVAPANAVRLLVVPPPLALTVDAHGGALKAGGTLELDVTVQRKDGSAEAVPISLTAPSSLKLSASPIQATPGQKAKLIVKAGADSPVGAAAGVDVRGTVSLRGETVEVNEGIAITIAK
ncbi:MAG: PPC domain-containing protein [Isosphaeraceae bacterium]